MKSRFWLAPLTLACALPRAHAETRSLTLETAIELGLAHSWTLRSLDSQRREADAKSDATLALGMPKVVAEGTYARLSPEVNELVGKNLGTQKNPETISKASLALLQPLTELGNAYYLNKAQIGEEQRLEAERQRQALGIALTVSEAYISDYKAQRMVEISKASVKLAETQMDNTRAMERVGKATTAEILRLNMALSEAQSQLAQVMAGADVSRKNLLTLLGLSQDVNLTLQLGNGDDSSTTPANPAEDLSRSEASRPEFRQFRLAKESTDALLSNQRIAWLPKASLFAKYERNFAQEDVIVPGGRKTYAHEDVRDTLSYGLNVSWTLYDGGLRSAERSELLEKQLRISHDENQFREGMALQLAQTDSQLFHLQAALKFARAAQESAEEFYRQQHTKFAHGVATSTDLVAAERDLTRARNAVVSAEADLHLAHIKKSHLLGQFPGSQKEQRR